MGAIQQYLLITIQGAVNREEFAQSVKKNTLQVFMVRSTQGKANWEIQTYAMLDFCSKGTFICTDLARKLKADGIKTTIKIKTLNGEDTQESEAISGLKVSKSIGKQVWIDLPVTYAKTDLPVGDKNVVTPNKIKE